ncbi:MAG: Fe-S cluster assembly protein SufD [Melioribacteraceae bacterium]|nr:MAG: Fe-S cluster assembly protein SufD [Melioribacteraceae bacterium]
MSKNENIKEWYISNFKPFEEKLNGQSKTFFHNYRKDALKKFAELEFPTTKNEEWKYTNVSPILKYNFNLAFNSDKPELTKEEIQKYLFDGFEYHLLVFVNGIFSKELSDIFELPEGAVVDSLNNVLKSKPELIKEHISKYSKIDNSFNALNSAFTVDGYVIYVPDGKIIEKPVQVLFLNGAEKDEILSLPRNIIITGSNSQVKVITNFYGYKKSTYLTNAVNEVYAGENSIVDLYKIQNENGSAFHIDKTDVYQLQKSVFSHYNFAFGGKLVRNDVNSVLGGEFTETNYYGIYLGNEKQHIDNHTFIDHAKPNCVSNELYKGILDDDSRGVFNGKIWVRPDAQKTNAYQSNKTILLSKNAKIDTKPQLEIYADDVKCSHGATIGRLDEQAYFYILSRGISPEYAKSMLIRAFANDVVEAVKIDELREQLNHMIFEHLHRIEI